MVKDRYVTKRKNILDKMWNITPEVIFDTLRGFRIIIFLGVILM